MAAPEAQVGELVVSLRAEVGMLRKDLDRARGEFRRATRTIKQEASGIQASLKSIKEPFSNIAQLTNAMGTAFGGAASKATALATGLVSSFAAGGIAGAAMSVFAGLVFNVRDALSKAGEAAEEASKKAAEAAEKEAARRRDVLTALRNEIRLQQMKADGKDPGLVALLESEADARGRAGIAAEKLRTVEADLARLEKQASEERAAALAQPANGLLQPTGTLPTITPQIDELRKRRQTLQEEQKFYLEQAELLKIQGGGAGGGGGKGGGGRAPAVRGPTGDPFATRESLAAYLRAAMAGAPGGQGGRRPIGRSVEGIKEATGATDDLVEKTKELEQLARDAGSSFESNFVDPLLDGTKSVEDALGDLLKEFLKLAAKFAIKGIFTAITGGIGGLIPFAEGGRVHGPGGPREDRVGPFALSNGEFVVNAAAAQRVGYPLLDAINNMEAPRPTSSQQIIHAGAPSITIQGSVGRNELRQLDALLRRAMIEQPSAILQALAASVEGVTGLRTART